MASSRNKTKKLLSPVIKDRPDQQLNLRALSGMMMRGCFLVKRVILKQAFSEAKLFGHSVRESLKGQSTGHRLDFQYRRSRLRL